MAPFFSIGVTTYDREEMLLETLRSILNQTFADYEVIVSNDNPDRKVSMKSTGICDPRFKFINQAKNLGELANMNYLMNNGTGKYFTWIADDDLYLPEYLEAIYKTIVKYSFPQCVFTSYEVFQTRIQKNSKSIVPKNDELLKGEEFLYKYSKKKLKTISVMGVFEQKTIKDIGGLEDISGDNKGMFSEYMLLVRAAMLDKVAFIREPLVMFRDHDGSWVQENIDLGMYRRAADNLTRKCIDVFKLPKFNKHFYTYIYAILKIAILNNVFVMKKRSEQGDRSVSKITAYLMYTRNYLNSLKRTKLYLIGLIALINVNTYMVFHLIGCAIRKTFRMLIHMSGE